MNRATPILSWVACAALTIAAGAQQGMPKEDVIDIPARSEGLCVSNLFQSHMVLQRDKHIRIWGWGEPRSRVMVTFGREDITTQVGRDGSWEVDFLPRAASVEPATMVIEDGSDTITLENILIGDVWVLGGQSNMEFPLERVDNGWLEIVSANYDQIRVLTVPAPQGPEVRDGFPRLHEWSGWFNRHFRKGDWDVLSPEIAFDLSAIGYVFARRIHMAAQIPIGVIDVSRGGTTVETWTPREVLDQIETEEVDALLADWDQRVAAFDPAADLAQRQQQHDNRVKQREERGEEIPANWVRPTDLRPGPAGDHNRPGTCFNSMISPIAGLSVKGVIFHQGYNNANGGSYGARMYGQIFPQMISAWRETFSDPELPFGIISLCTDGARQTRDNYVELMLNDGIYIREAQYQTFMNLRDAGDEQIGFASSFDKRRGWYHPQQKIPVGERIARWALATQYGFARRIPWLPPQITEMKVEEGRIVLHFDRNVSAEDNQAAMEGFAIAGEDRRFHPATSEWLETGRDRNNRPQRTRRAVVLSSPHVPNPIHFRYAWGRNPMGNVQSADHSDLPLATQRSDDWPMETVPLGVLGEAGFAGGKLDRGTRNKLRQALRAEDLWRRLTEARALLDEHGEAEPTATGGQ